MQPALQITFRGLPASAVLRDVVERRLEKLSFLLDSCASCRVVFDRSPGGQRHGGTVSARIELHGVANGATVFVQASHVDAASAAREAFDRAGRRAAHAPTNAARRRQANGAARSGLGAIGRAEPRASAQRPDN